VIFENLRYRVAHLLLRRKQAGFNRQKALYDFASAKNVGILTAVQDEAGIAHVKEFLSYLARNSVKYTVFGYFIGKTIPENFLYLKDMDFITSDDLSFFYIPEGDNIQKFIDEQFDMLINCNIANHFPVEYIAQLSHAKCKVAIMREKAHGYDLLIDISKERTIDYFLKNLVVYLTNLKISK